MTTAKPGAEALSTACSTLLVWEILKATHRWDRLAAPTGHVDTQPCAHSLGSHLHLLHLPRRGRAPPETLQENLGDNMCLRHQQLRNINYNNNNYHKIAFLWHNIMLKDLQHTES